MKESESRRLVIKKEIRSCLECVYYAYKACILSPGFIVKSFEIVPDFCRLPKIAEVEMDNPIWQILCSIADTGMLSNGDVNKAEEEINAYIATVIKFEIKKRCDICKGETV